MELKTKINKWDLIKSFCTAKETINRMKRQSSDWEKIIASEAIDKRLTYKIYKQLRQINIRKTNHPIKKQEEDPNRHFSKEDIQMADKHMIRCSASLIIQFSSVTQLCLTLCDPMKYSTPGLPVQWDITSHWSEWLSSKKSTSNKFWRGCGEKGTFLNWWWECKLIQPLWRTVRRFLKKLGMKLSYDPLRSIYLRKP